MVISNNYRNFAARVERIHSAEGTIFLKTFLSEEVSLYLLFVKK